MGNVNSREHVATELFLFIIVEEKSSRKGSKYETKAETGAASNLDVYPSEYRVQSTDFDAYNRFKPREHPICCYFCYEV